MICISARSTCSRLQPLEFRNSLTFSIESVERQTDSGPMVRACFCTRLDRRMVTRSRRRSASLRSASARSTGSNSAAGRLSRYFR